MLNIKDPAAHELAREIARQTGESLTRAVTEALRERLVRLNRSRKPPVSAQELLAIVAVLFNEDDAGIDARAIVQAESRRAGPAHG